MLNVKTRETSNSSEKLQENEVKIDNGEDLLSARQFDHSIEQVSNQLKDKLGVKAGQEKTLLSRPPNGCWLGVNLNGENGFTCTTLDSHKIWSQEIRDTKTNEVVSQSPGSAPSPQQENTDRYPGELRISSRHQGLINTPPTTALTSPESDQGYGKSPETDTNNDFVNDDSVKQQRIEPNCKSSDLVLGPYSYSYVSLEKSTPVAVVRPKPKVHVANSVIATATLSAGTTTTPSSFSPIVTSLCTYSNSDTNGADGIGYVAYQSELQMPDIMRLIQKDLSEPYSIYTYRYFIHNWPKLCFLAMDGDKCVGAIVCKLDLHKKVVRRGYIAMLAVDENYRKRKIGSNLVLKAIQAMVVDDADEVVLETEISNKPALRLYENLGFVRDKRLFRYYLNGVDALRLKLWLR